MLKLEEHLKEADAVYISFDKGYRKDVRYFPKNPSLCYKNNNKVIGITLDADGPGNLSEDCSQAIEDLPKKVRGLVKVLVVRLLIVVVMVYFIF